KKLRKILPDDAQIITPYGATESLPLAAIESREILGETAAATRRGAGICVGKFFDTIERRIIPTTDDIIENLNDIEPLPTGQIGELLVSGPQVTRRYVTRVEANAYALVKGEDGQIWRRVGDVGYIDEQNRFWFCGRKSHRVETPDGPMFTIPCEAISNESPKVYRSALVGVPLPPDFVEPAALSARAISQRENWRKPAMVVEPLPEARPKTSAERDALCAEVLSLLKASELTVAIDDVLICESFPVDVRHNAKINREKLAVWASDRLADAK
ncbi:MAG: AMP-binding protein, partial [Thermoguttaceae bacterium]|nr:AMP-binding protein [Thermoguttaceae bacterium]